LIICPICGRELPAVSPGEKSFAPFCSQRCQQVDFHRWWQGKYAIADDVDLANLPPGEYELMRDDEE
jgi:endogenous inhibitor of DNA gyrase (YacG/DUF329 family)